uniref:Uncharacterized protein n=1 Tax=Timema genevievae TaxID=629358 RepID=A0A7R9K352_TIMGE|nr:unnamed protein product [Timema genevievae]
MENPTDLNLDLPILGSLAQHKTSVLAIYATEAGIHCNFDGKQNNILSEVGLDHPNYCPRPLIDTSDKIFCCSKDRGNRIYCCDISEFGQNGWVHPVIIGIIAAAVAVLLIGLFICCCCCPCCLCYKRCFC